MKKADMVPGNFRPGPEDGVDTPARVTTWARIPALGPAGWAARPPRKTVATGPNAFFNMGLDILDLRAFN